VTSEQRRLLLDSWAPIAADGDRLAALFYERLFELDPAARQLFAETDMVVQRKKFLDMLGEIVNVIDQPDSLVPDVVSLARRHVDYGVEASQYATVGQALVWMLEEGLRDDFSDDVRRAWADAYRFVAALMQRTAGGAARTA
jgi:hemoglobin-like flavoprotein